MYKRQGLSSSVLGKLTGDVTACGESSWFLQLADEPPSGWKGSLQCDPTLGLLKDQAESA